MGNFSIEDADIHRLYQSDFYQVLDFKCRCKECSTSKPEYSESFCISFVRKGNFLFNVFRRSLDSYTGCVLVSKPEAERTVTHVHAVPDECTIFDFTTAFYRQLLERYGRGQFFKDVDWHSALVWTDTEIEYLHFYILQLIREKAGSRLQIDQLVLQMAGRVLDRITDHRSDPAIHDRLKKHHLSTVEKAKEYISIHFTRDLSLMEIATACHVSPFHFSRVFKLFTKYSPHQFLLGVRLQHAAMLLRTTGWPVADVGFSSGFNSIEHFTWAFSQEYKYPPAKFRERETLLK